MTVFCLELTGEQGVGGDIGGSIRCPAAFVGVYGFKYVEYSPEKDHESY